jgi:hypothetical protein
MFDASKFVSFVVNSDKCNFKNVKQHYTTLLFTNDFNLPTLMASLSKFSTKFLKVI